jgi:hypothetical protein
LISNWVEPNWVEPKYAQKWDMTAVR